MHLSEFSVPSAERYFEHYVAGSVFEYGPAPVDAQEAENFIQKFGPGFLDETGAGPRLRNAEPGNRALNEWHVMGIMMRLFVYGFLPAKAAIASPGVDNIRWLKPVWPGDTLRIRVTIVEAKRSQSKPDRGMIRAVLETFNQHGDLVLSLTPMSLVRCRAGV